MYRFSYQVTMVIFITAVTIASIVGYIGLQAYSNSARIEAEDKLLLTTQATARELDNYFEAQVSSTQAIRNMIVSTYDIHQSKLDPEYLEKYRALIGPAIKGSGETTPGCVAAYFWLDPSSANSSYVLSYNQKPGTGEFEALPNPGFEQFDSSRPDMVWYYQAISAQHGIWTGPFASTRVGRTLLSYSVPVIKDGITLGVVGQALDLETLRYLLSNIRPYQSDRVFLLDSTLKPITGSSSDTKRNPPAIDEDLYQALMERTKSNVEGIIPSPENPDYGRDSVMSAFMRLNNGYFLLMEVPEEEFLTQIRQIQRLSLGILALFVILTTILAIAWGRQLSEPLKIALEYAETLSGEHINETVLEDMAARPDEFGQIAKAIKRAVHYHSMEIRHNHLEVVQRLSQVSEFRDRETAAHVSRVAVYSALLGCLAGLDDRQVEHLLLTAPMHDIGKVGIPDAILQKPGSLNPDEWQIMRNHPLIGANILHGGKSQLLKMAYSIALHHHERWDGQGYPIGLQGEQIPFEARICALCDSFDAMTGPRIYRTSLSFEEAIREIEVNSGTQFDPRLVGLLLENLGTLRNIYSDENHLSRLKGRQILDYTVHSGILSGFGLESSPAL